MVIVLRMPFQCSLCFLWGLLLKFLRAGSLHITRHLFLFNPLCYYTLVFNICMELMFKGPAMADTILPETTQSRKLILVLTMMSVQKRQSKQHTTQSRMEHAATETGWGKLKSCWVACSGVTRVTSPPAQSLTWEGAPALSELKSATKIQCYQGVLNQEVKNISPFFLATSCPQKHFKRRC